MKDKVVTKTVVSEETYTLVLDENELISILMQRFQHLGNNIMVSINCSQDMLDSVVISVKNQSISRDEIKLSELPK